MTSQAPESPEVVGERARAYARKRREELAIDEEWAPQGPASPVAAEHARAVVRYAWRRPPVVAVVSPVMRAEAPPPQRHAPVNLAVSPAVTWEQAQAAERAAEPWGAVCERILALPVLLRGPEPERKPAPVALPAVPELVTGADAAARRARMARLAATIGEARALLAGEPVAVVRRAQDALGRGA